MRNITKCVFNKINIVFFIIILIIISGCQPTPERTAVVNGGGLEESIKGSPAPIVTYDAPASWQETLDMKGSDTKVEINTQINVPDVTAFPVYKVKQTEFDEARIKSLVNYFTKGKDVIKYAEPTKSELEKQLIIAQKNNDQETIADLEKKIATAPETVELEVITDWSPDKSPSGSFLEDDGEYAGISVKPNIFGCTYGYNETESILALNGNVKIEDIAISKEDAIAAAQDMLHELGIDYMVAGSLEKAQRYASLEDAFVQPAEKPLSKGYLIKFARNIDGISGITDEGLSFNVMDEFAYKAPLYPEEIRVYVDEAGKVWSFEWFNPLTIEEIINENAVLLPFADVKQRIRDMLFFVNSYNTSNITVTSIDMKMTIVNVKDHPEEAMYVPAWFIYYTKIYDTECLEYKLVLNAIDGGRVLECPVDLSPEMQQAMDEDLQALN